VKDRRLAQIVKIIGRDKANFEIIEGAIGFFDRKQRSRTLISPWPPFPQNKREKSIATRFGRALKKLEDRFTELEETLANHRHRAHAEAALEQAVLDRAIYGEQDKFLEWKAQLKHWRERLEIFGGKAKPEPNGLLPIGPTTWPLGPPKPFAYRKHDAVKAAAAILKGHGLRLTATRKSDTRKTSVFCQVAAIVSGDRDVYHECRVFLKARN
jgi:hypothetical protein